MTEDNSLGRYKYNWLDKLYISMGRRYIATRYIPQRLAKESSKIFELKKAKI